MNLSEKGLGFICGFEGYYDTAYQDQAKIWTIGYGTIKYPTGIVVKKGDKCTQEKAKLWLLFEVGEKTAALNRLLSSINLSLLQSEYDALVSFIYNVGAGKLQKGTTMGDAIHSKDKKKIAEAFLVYNKYTNIFKLKVVSKGLDRRRKAEKALFESA